MLLRQIEGNMNRKSQVIVALGSVVFGPSRRRSAFNMISMRNSSPVRYGSGRFFLKSVSHEESGSFLIGNLDRCNASTRDGLCLIFSQHDLE